MVSMGEDDGGGNSERGREKAASVEEERERLGVERLVGDRGETL